MDWISWLSSSGLHPRVAYEYGLAFSHNELEHEDILYFNHEFLLSLGISIAKHRLQILKLARSDAAALRRPPLSRRFRLALALAKRRLQDLIRNLTRRPPALDGATKALILLPRSKKFAPAKRHGTLLITNGSPAPPGGGLWPRIESFSGPIVCDFRREEKEEKGDCYWGNEVEEIRWDAMFQNLKPT